VRILVLTVGRPARWLAGAIEEYETRAARYWSLEVIEVREEKSRKGMSAEAVRAAESGRLRERIPGDMRIVALTRTGDPTSSERLARDLARLAVEGAPGVAYVIGGAHGLSDELLRDAHSRVRLSTMTLPHDLARLVLAEQLYRAGTIMRNEPYHKAIARE
jgi:23S rRNA (pseudouridine1915-N3)-methyltransferase